MELFIPDAFLYVSFVIMTAFFVNAAIKLATFLIYSLWNGNVYCFLLYCAVYLPEERILV